MNQLNIFNDIFYLSQTGFEVLSILIMAAIVVGIIVFIIFFRDLSGKKAMLFGGELILLGFIFSSIESVRYNYPSLSFITILIGVIISTIGLSKRD